MHKHRQENEGVCINFKAQNHGLGCRYRYIYIYISLLAAEACLNKVVVWNETLFI